MTADDVAALASRGPRAAAAGDGAPRAGRGDRGLGGADSGPGRVAVRPLRRRGQPGRGRRRAGGPGRVRGPGRGRVRDRVAPCWPTSSRSPAGSARRGRASPSRRSDRRSPCAPSRQNASRRRPAPATPARTRTTVTTTDPPRPQLVERYREFLPVTEPRRCVSLGEGSTPLVHARRLGEALGARRPATSRSRARTRPGAFKDRGMVLAVAKALEEGARERDLRLDRQHLGVGRRVRRGRRARVRRGPARGQDRRRQAAPGAGRSAPASISVARQLRRRAPHRPRAVRAGRAPDHARQLRQPVPARGPEDGGVRGVRRPRPRARRPRDPGRQRRQHLRLLARLPRVPRCGPGRGGPADAGASRPPGAAPLVSGRPVDEPETVATAIRIGNPASWTLAIGARDESGGRIDAGHGRRDPRRAPRPRAPRGRVLRAVVRRIGRGRRARPPRSGGSTPTRPSCAC